MCITTKKLVQNFLREENGLALTEYLILLGLLTSGVILAVLSVGAGLNTAWSSWATWFDGTTLNAPAVP